jgi:hypothetical protein
MQIVDAIEIKGFPEKPALNGAAILNITVSQLQKIIQDNIKNAVEAAVEKAVLPLIDKIRILEEKIAGLEKTQDVQGDNQLIQLRLIKKAEDKITVLETPKEQLQEHTQKTINRLNQIAAILGNKEQALVNSEAPRAYISRLRHEGLTFSQLANIMELTVDRIRQLSRIAATDQRFNITWHPRKKNTKIFKLRRWDVQGL